MQGLLPILEALGRGGRVFNGRSAKVGSIESIPELESRHVTQKNVTFVY